MNRWLYFKRFVSLVLVMASVSILVGCQLAKPEASIRPDTDALIGVYITTEYVDLFNPESIIIKNGELIFDESNQQRLYASQYDPKTGACVFDGYDGIFFASNTYTDDNGNINTGVANNGYVSDVKIAISDEAESIEGTLIVGNSTVVILHMNPVYRTSDGQIYLVNGSGMSFDVDSGCSGSQTISESNTVTTDGKTTTKSFSVTMNYVCKDVADFYRIKFMNPYDIVVNVMEIQPSDMPDELDVPNDVEYLIVEQILNDSVTERAIITDEAYLNLHVFEDGSIARYHGMLINH